MFCTALFNDRFNEIDNVSFNQIKDIKHINKGILNCCLSILSFYEHKDYLLYSTSDVPL